MRINILITMLDFFAEKKRDMELATTFGWKIEEKNLNFFYLRNYSHFGLDTSNGKATTTREERFVNRTTPKV